MGIKKVPGFSNVTDGFVDLPLDFNRLLVQHPAATFVLRASGPNLAQLGLQPDDLLVVDRSQTPRNGCLLICPLDGELLVKRYWLKNKRIVLSPGSQTIDPQDFVVWGVVTYVIKKV